MLRFRLALATLSLVVLAGVWSPRAAAQQAFNLSSHQTTTGPDDGVLLLRPSTLPARALHVQLRTEYTNRPLMVTLRGSTTHHVAFVEHRLAGALSVSYGLTDRVDVFVSLPYVLHQRGSAVLGLPDAASRGLSDLTLGVHAQIFGGAEGAQLGFGLALVEPTGAVDAFASDDRVGATSQLRFAYVGHGWALGSALGVSLRPDREWLTHQTGADLTLVLGGFYLPVQGLRLGAELALVTGLSDKAFFERRRTPLEVDLSGRLQITDALYGQAAVGLGFVNGVGNPRVRATLTLGWVTEALR